MAFAGFDTGSFPGINALQAWRGTSPYGWVGFYLTSPCHTAETFAPWAGHRAEIASLGYGMAIVYVGRFQGGCGQDSLTRAQGFLDGQDAVQLTLNDGFLNSATIFLDVEHFNPPMTQEMEDYVRGWLNFLKTSSQFNPGIYVHHANFDEVNLAAEREYASIGLPAGHPKYWILFDGPPFDLATSKPQDCGIALANMWQAKIDLQDEPPHGGVIISPIDQNVADSPDPSAPSTGV